MDKEFKFQLALDHFGLALKHVQYLTDTEGAVVAAQWYLEWKEKFGDHLQTLIKENM